MATLIDRLKDLAAGWYVDLRFDGTDWRLCLTLRTEPSPKTFVYVSRDIDRVINHAWAGAPEGRC
jgi:hypothetical protein